MSRFSRRAAALFAAIVCSFALAAPRASALEIKRIQLADGAVLLVSEQHQLPMVTMAIAFDAGARRDPKDQGGLATLTAESLMQGTKDLSAAEFNREVDFMGSAIDIGASRDFAVASVTSLKKYQSQSIHLLAQLLQNPGLREADIRRKQADQIADIKSSEEEPGYAADVAFTKTIFGDSPYGHMTEGSSDSVAKLTPAEVADFYRTYYQLGNAIIAVAGDVDAQQIKAELESEFTGLKGSIAPQSTPAPIMVAPGIHVQVIDRNVAQANLILGSGGVARSNPDYYKLQVMNYILGGGGFASRLMKVVRSQHGLAYSIGSAFDAGKFQGAFTVVLQTKNASANEALKLILAQMREIQAHPVSDVEMESAKKFLIGSFPLKLDRQSSIVGFMLQTEIYGLGLDYADRYPKIIAAISKDDVQKVARAYLHPDALDLVAVANQSEAKIDLAKFAPPRQSASNH